MNASNAQLSLYHPNGKGTGCAIKMKLVPAHDLDAGYIAVTLAPQLAVAATETGERVYPRFDWDNALTENLAFDDLTKLLQVFRGESETLEDGKGIFHRSTGRDGSATVIRLTHHIEPTSCYVLELSKRRLEDGDERRAHFAFMPSEALGIEIAIEDSFGVLCFGVPEVAD